MRGLRLLNNGEWNKPPVLMAARRILINGLSAHFDLCTLGETASFLNGTSYDVAQISEVANAPIIRISNITDPSSTYLRTNEALDQKFWVCAGDLLVSWSASFKSTIWPGPAGYLNQHIFKVTEREGFDRRFVRHAIEASFDEMQENVVGIGMMHLRRADFLGHRVPAPGLEVQRAVADFLDNIEVGQKGHRRELPPILAEQQRVVARIEALATQIAEARSLRLQAAEEAKALILSALTHLRLPRGSVTRRIAECSSMRTGTTPPSDRSDYYGGPIQWYTPGDLEYQQRLRDSSRTLSELALAQRKARIFEPGTVLLVAIGGSLGKVALTHGRCSANQQITGIKFSNDVLPEYGFWWMRRLGKELMAAAPKATLPIINQERIGAFEISIPPLAEQRQIVTELDALQAEIDALKRLQAESAAELEALLPAALDRAFKGEL